MPLRQKGGGGSPPEILFHLERNGVPTTLSVCGQFFVILYTIGVGVGVRMGCPFVVSLRPSSCPGTAVEHRTAPIAARGNDGWVTGVVDSHNLTYGSQSSHNGTCGAIRAGGCLNCSCGHNPWGLKGPGMMRHYLNQERYQCCYQGDS